MLKSEYNFCRNDYFRFRFWVVFETLKIDHVWPLCRVYNHCDLNFWSIWTNFVSKYAQKLNIFVKKKSFLGILWVKKDKSYFPPDSLYSWFGKIAIFSASCLNLCLTVNESYISIQIHIFKLLQVFRAVFWKSQF